MKLGVIVILRFFDILPIFHILYNQWVLPLYWGRLEAPRTKSSGGVVVTVTMYCGSIFECWGQSWLREEEELSQGTGRHSDGRRRGPRGSGRSPRLRGDRGRCGLWAPAPCRILAGVVPSGLRPQSRAWVPVTEGNHSFWNQIFVKLLRERQEVFESRTEIAH